MALLHDYSRRLFGLPGTLTADLARGGPVLAQIGRAVERIEEAANAEDGTSAGMSSTVLLLHLERVNARRDCPRVWGTAQNLSREALPSRASLDLFREALSRWAVSCKKYLDEC